MSIIFNRRTMFRGNPCKRNHSGLRYRKGGRCVECSSVFGKGAKLQKRYGITSVEFEGMLKAQGNVCAVCAHPFHSTPVVDHDHVTGAVRGLLHTRCNTALGTVEWYDFKMWLRGAGRYLRKPPATAILKSLRRRK